MFCLPHGICMWEKHGRGDPQVFGCFWNVYCLATWRAVLDWDLHLRLKTS